MIQTVMCPTSCGLVLLRGEQHYKTPEVYFKDMAVLGQHNTNYTQFLYTHSETGHPEIGDKIAKYIHDNNLGYVVKSRPGGNPIHQGREISVWVWTRDNDNFRKHCQELLAPKSAVTDAPKKEELCLNSTPPRTAGHTNSMASVSSTLVTQPISSPVSTKRKKRATDDVVVPIPEGNGKLPA